MFVVVFACAEPAPGAKDSGEGGDSGTAGDTGEGDTGEGDSSLDDSEDPDSGDTGLTDTAALTDEDLIATLAGVPCGHNNYANPSALLALDDALLIGNADGCPPDILVTHLDEKHEGEEPHPDDAGIVYIWTEPVEGSHTLDEAPQFMAAPAELRGDPFVARYFGWPLAAVGDTGGVAVGSGQFFMYVFEHYLDDEAAWYWYDPSAGMDLASVLAAGDLDADGLPEVLFRGEYNEVDNHPMGEVIVVAGGPTGQLGPGDELARITNYSSTFATDFDVVGDADGDGLDDVVVRGDDHGDLRLYLGPIAGELGASEANRTLSDANYYTRVAAVGDANDDGLADVFAADPSGGSPGWIIGSPGAGTWTGESVLATLRCSWTEWSVDNLSRVGDQDGDGIADYLVAFSSDVSWLVPGVLTGSMDCVDVGRRIVTSIPDDEHGEFAAGPDLDNDAANELAILSETTGSVLLFSALRGSAE